MKFRFDIAVQIAGFAAIALFMALEGTANAQQCEPKIMEAVQATQQAKTAVDVGITQQIVRKPDSALAMTCFDKAAKVAAQRGGNVFSGEFWTTGLDSAVQGEMSEILRNFNGSLLQQNPSFSGLFTAAATSLGGPGTFSCDLMRDLWSSVEGASLNSLVPTSTMDDLVTAAYNSSIGPGIVMPPGVTAASELGQSLQRTYPLLNTVRNKILALPRATIPNYGGANTINCVLRRAGVPTAGPCP